MYKIPNILFVLVFIGSSHAHAGIALGVQKAWNTKESNVVITGGYMLQSSRRDWEYYEGGVVVLPGSRSGLLNSDVGKYSRQYQNSAYGVYGGYYVYLMSILRPGILVGTTIRDNVVYASDDAALRGAWIEAYSDFRFDYYVAFSVQVGLFSFILSNYGIGGGLNYMF